MPNVVMLLSNAFRPDPRVAKEADSLAAADYSVTIVCWDRAGELPAEETLPNGVHILRIHNVRTIYGAGIKQISYMPRFWSAAIKMALPHKPEVVHCHDLDTLYAGVQIKKQLSCHLVFDAHEDYPTLMSLYLPGLFVPMLNALERHWLHHADAVLAASSVYMDKLAGYHFASTTYLPNVPDLEPFEQVNSEQLRSARQELGVDSNAYVVGYIGGFSRNRLLLPLIEAVRGMPSVSLLLAGDGHQRKAIEEAVCGVANMRYLGWLPAAQVPLYTSLCDVIYYCLKPDYPGAVYNAPNTLANAMSAGRPVIANNLGDLGRIIQKTGCGIVLDEVTPQTIRAAIQDLSDPLLRSRYGEAGLAAAQKEYNWQAVEQRLLHLYHSLIDIK